jgi:hypothetical protein
MQPGLVAGLEIVMSKWKTDEILADCQSKVNKATENWSADELRSKLAAPRRYGRGRLRSHRATLMTESPNPIDRTACGFAIFQECDPATCQRRCFTACMADIAANDVQTASERAKEHRLWASLVLAALIPVFIFAASVGLARAERAHQQEARV